MHIVQPALSVQIRALEEELGAALFERSTRRVALTDAGRLLLGEAQRTIEQAERTKSLIQRAARGETGIVRIGFVGNALASARLSEDLGAFHDAWPNVVLDLQEMMPAEQQEAILAGRLDIGYCSTFGVPFDARLAVRTLGRWPWYVALGARHPLARQPSLDVSALMDESFIVYAAEGDDEGQLAILRQILGKEPRIAHRMSSMLSMLAVTAAGLGVTLAPEPISHMTLPNVVFRELLGDVPKSDLVVITRAGGEWGPIQRYLEMLDEGNQA
ncbi:LysR family transcriptional regulator [Pseudomonas xantholysinigenes]|uniref:LysR family transcriptional regulator n=1 Tax=Pseudomonas xantholysinigenes TaxID=2745490 RepID=UPI001CECD4F6